MCREGAHTHLVQVVVERHEHVVVTDELGGDVDEAVVGDAAQVLRRVGIQLLQHRGAAEHLAEARHLGLPLGWDKGGVQYIHEL